MAYKVEPTIRQYVFANENTPSVTLFALNLMSMSAINSFVDYRDENSVLTQYKVEKAIIEVQRIPAVPDDVSPPTAAGYEAYFIPSGKVLLSVIP